MTPEEMTAKAIAAFKMRMKEIGWKQAELARQLGKNPPDISRLFRYPEQGRAAALRTLNEYAQVLGLNLSDVLATPVPPPVPVDHYAVPLAGAVGAGPGQDDPAEPGAMLHVHTLFTGDCVAYQVCGRSMESELIGDGDYVIVRRSPAPDSGERVVAWSRSSEGMVVRRLRVDGDGTRWYEAAPKDGPRYRRPVQPDDVIYGVYCGIVRRVDPPATRSKRKRS